MNWWHLTNLQNLKIKRNIQQLNKLVTKVTIARCTVCCNLKLFCCFRFDKNGICLFSVFSIVMSGNNRYVDDLRILAYIEFFLNSEFQAQHPSFVKVMNTHAGAFNNVDTLVALPVLHGTLHCGRNKMKLVIEEALIICSPFKW